MNNFRDKIRGLIGLHTALEGLLTTINQIPVSGGGSVADEKVIGTWLDGKPLYRKTISIQGNGTSLIHAPSSTLDSAVCKVKNMTCFRTIISQDNVGDIVPRISYNRDKVILSNIIVGQDTTGVFVQDSHTEITNEYIFYLTVDYTKTTD